MRARQVAAVGVAAIAGAALVNVHRLHEAAANMRRYSMPSAGVYDLVTHLLFGRRYDEIARAVADEAPEGGTVVDLGSGTGEVLVRLAALAPSLQLTGIDIDADMVARASRKAQRLGARPDGPRLQFLVGDAAALPFADDSVDLVVSSYAVHHLPDRHAARDEILRVLKPGARALIWDIVSPHGQPEEPGTAGASANHGGPHGQAPGARHANPLDTVRTLIRFGRIPAERYELQKPER